MKKWVAANWKLNKSPKETKAYFDRWIEIAPSLKIGPDCGVAFFPPATSLETISLISARQSSFFSFGAQNCYFEGHGAFTGEVSAQIVQEMGGEMILIGHSERRTLFHESDFLLAKKVRYVQSLGLCPVFCVGETLEERQAGKTAEVLRRQIREALPQAQDGLRLIVAYEPVWAIGTGQVASLAQVEEAHALVRAEINDLGWEKSSILYGGSVKAENAGALGRIPHVHGFLVGGASLDPQSFAEIVRAL